MRIDANARTISKLLINEKFEIDFYQREYSWGTEHVSELIDDLTTTFEDNYKEGHEREQVSHYSHYFLGSIIISHSDGKKYIVDGQQRFTTLTLLLIRLYHLLEDDDEKKGIEPLIFSQSGAKKGFNLYIDDWIPIMEHIYPQDRRESVPFDVNDRTESIQNIYSRYNDIEDYFEFQGKKLLFFIDWLLNNVYLVEIAAYDTKDAYAIFETVNDRGLLLTPSDMLRGYLLSNIQDPNLRERASKVWNECAQKLNQIGKNEITEGIKAWLRSQYAQNISDFDEIGSEFHRWVGKNEQLLGLNSSNNFTELIENDFSFYIRWYCRLRKAANSLAVAAKEKLEYVYYNSQHNKFTLQYPFIMATLSRSDSEDENLQKVRILSQCLDTLIYRRIWNLESIAQNTMANLIPPIIPELRGKSSNRLIDFLYSWLQDKTNPFNNNETFRLQSGYRGKIFLTLARITDYVIVQSEDSSNYQDFMRTGKNPYEIEHIWAKDFTPHQNEFDEQEFNEYRDRIGGLLLLPKSVNASIRDKSYEEKRKVYSGQNLLAKSLHENAYLNNPCFHRFIERSGIPFEEHERFKKEDLEKRQKLYLRLAEEIWNPEKLKSDFCSQQENEQESEIENIIENIKASNLENFFEGKISNGNKTNVLIKSGIEQIHNEIQSIYKMESPDKVQELYVRSDELFDFIEEKGWNELTFKAKKLYCAFYMGINPIFGLFLSKHPQFVVWLDQEDVQHWSKNNDFNYISSRRQAIYPQHTPIRELFPILEYVYEKHKAS